MQNNNMYNMAATASSAAALNSAGDLPYETSKNGLPVFSYAGKRMHSYMDPIREANQYFSSILPDLEKFINKNSDKPKCILVLGLGLGYFLKLLQTAIEAGGVNLRVLCYEPIPEIARLALRLKVWEPSKLDVAWIVGDFNRDEFTKLTTDHDIFLLKCSNSFATANQNYEYISQAVYRNTSSARPMRILVPTPLYGGSYPAALHCHEAFLKLGHKSELLDLSPYYPLYANIEKMSHNSRHRNLLQQLLTAFLAEMISARAMDWKADFVWAVAQTPLTPPALDEMRSQGIHTALWFVEDFRLFPYWTEVCTHYDALFTIQRGEFHKQLAQRGVRDVYYLPCAANPNAHYPQNLSKEDKTHYGSDASFIGAGYPNRQAAFSQLELQNFKIWGNDWSKNMPAWKYVQENGRRVTTEETAKIFSASCVNINLHSSMNEQAGRGDFVNPRTFEIGACGGFQLVDRRGELAELFTDGSEVIVYDRVEQIPELIRKYLADGDARNQISMRCRERVLREHTYEHRMRDAIDFLKTRLPRLRDQKRGPKYIDSLIQVAGDDMELVKFLKIFEDREDVSLDSIVSEIKIGEKPLTRAEGLFLLMKEFQDWGREKGVIS